MQEITYEEKLGFAENYVEAFNERCKFFNDFVRSFDLNAVQLFALSHLIELVQTQEQFYQEALSAGLNLKDLFDIYDGERGEEAV